MEPFKGITVTMCAVFVCGCCCTDMHSNTQVQLLGLSTHKVYLSAQEYKYCTNNIQICIHCVTSLHVLCTLLSIGPSKHSFSESRHSNVIVGATTPLRSPQNFTNQILFYVFKILFSATERYPHGTTSIFIFLSPEM